MRSLSLWLLLACGAPPSTGSDPPTTAQAESENNTPARTQAPTSERPAPNEESESPAQTESDQSPTPSEAQPESPTGSAQSAAFEPVAGSVRLVVVHDAELLGSETRRIAQIARRLGRGRTLADDAPSEAEAQAALGWIEGTGRQVPERWARDETIVALHVGVPRTLRSGRRVSRGLIGVAVFRPGAEAPWFDARIDPQSAWPFRDGTAAWLADLVGDVGGSR